MKKAIQISSPDIDSLIIEVRGQKVIFDADLARIYGVPTKALNQAVKRNKERFPEDFVFRLTTEEAKRVNRSQSVPGLDLRSQIVTSNAKRGGRRSLPYAFTEHGAIMTANILNSTRAVQMSVFVVRAFVKMRAALMETRGLAQKLAAVEAELKSRLDRHLLLAITRRGWGLPFQSATCNFAITLLAERGPARHSLGAGGRRQRQRLLLKFPSPSSSTNFSL